MAVEERVREFRRRIDTVAKEGVRVANLALTHEARKLPLEPGPDAKQWYEVDVWLEGPDNVRSDVRSVNYELHPTFNPREVTRSDAPRFALRLRVWGEFTIRAQLHFTDGSTIGLVRYLSLPK